MDEMSKKLNHEELYELIKKKYKTTPSVIKQKLQKQKFFRYYFKERTKIRKWNKKVNLIKFKLFGSKMKMVQNYKKLLDEFYIKYIFPIHCFLPEILKNGWRWEIITIKEYNLIVYFKDFYIKLQTLEKEKKISKKSFDLMEESFLKLIYKKYFAEMLIGAFRKILVFLQKSNTIKEENNNSVILNLQLFFAPEHFRPSFFDLIRAMNMVRFNKYVKIKDIITQKSMIIIQSDFYNCSKETFTHIVIYLENNIRLLKQAENEKKYLDWIKAYGYFKKNKTPLKIKEYYESLGLYWKNDTDDTFLLLIVLFEGIIKDLNEVLFNEWQVMTDEEKIIRTQIISSYDIDSYYKDLIKNYELVKSRHSTCSLKNINLTDFIESKNPEVRLFDKNHLYIFEKTQNILFCLRNIAQIFHDIYKDNINKPNRLLNFMIAKSSLWKGKPVHSILLYYMELLLQMCGFFKEKKLLLELRKGEKIENKIKYFKDKISWIGDNNNIILKELHHAT